MHSGFGPFIRRVGPNKPSKWLGSFEAQNATHPKFAKPAAESWTTPARPPAPPRKGASSSIDNPGKGPLLGYLNTVAKSPDPPK